jgi:hypothetical protein
MAAASVAPTAFQHHLRTNTVGTSASTRHSIFDMPQRHRQSPTTGLRSMNKPLARRLMPEHARRALEQVLTFRCTSAIEVYETLREALAGDPGDA